MKELKLKLEELAASEVWSDDPDFMVDDFAGGNMDDAFAGGQRDGEVTLARELLSKFFT